MDSENKEKKTVKVTELHKLSPGLNIEGGLPQIALTKNNKNSIWVNVVTVLDCPLVGEHNITFDELVRTNPYPLLENAILEINERHFLATYLTIIGYYLENGFKLVKLDDKEKLNITIHIHQDVTCKPLMRIIECQMNDMIEYFNVDMDKINIDFRTDTPTYVTTDRNYDNTNILISLSQCAGFDEKYPAGTLITPTEFIPYDIKKKEIDYTKKYIVPNDLVTNINDILESKYNKYAVEYVNKNYHSNNQQKDKLHTAKILEKSDFHHLPLLHVDMLWNPDDRKEEIVIIE